MYFFVALAINKLAARRSPGQVPDDELPPPSDDVVLVTEIRDTGGQGGPAADRAGCRWARDRHPSTGGRVGQVAVVPRSLLETGVSPDPFSQFGLWFAEGAPASPEPYAMALATASPSGQPSARMVLLKEWDDTGFVFHSSYRSRKGEDLAGNPNAALLFYWGALGRQIRVVGTVTRLEEAGSDAYFRTRPRGAQIAARASHQSEPVEGRAALENLVRDEAARWGVGAEVPRPEWWGGYRLRPAIFEFWQHRDDRLHDRLLYRRDGSSWALTRLQP